MTKRWLHFPSGGSITIQLIQFDGTNDYLTRGADLTGTADGKVGTISFWFRVDGGDGALTHFLRATGGRWRLSKDSNNKIMIGGDNTSDVNILNILSTTSFAAGGGVHHALFAWDLANAKTHLYVDDADDENTGATVQTNDTVDQTAAGWTFGATATPDAHMNGDIGEFWWDQNYLDISVTANRRKFITAGLLPVSLGADGSTPTGTAPIMFLSGAVATWETNKGTGGGFTENGTIADGGTYP